MSRNVGTEILPTVAALPITGAAGQLVYLSTDDKVYKWDTAAGAWAQLGAGGSGSKHYAFFIA